jgi:hypothetical protein
MNLITWILVIAFLWYIGLLQGFMMWLAFILMSTATMMGAGV